MNSNNKSILIVTDVFPFPANKNGNTENIYNLIFQLKKQFSFKIDLLYIGAVKNIGSERIGELSKMCDNVFLRNLRNSKFIRFSYFTFKTNFDLKENYETVFFATFLSAYTRFNFNLNAKFILYQADSRTLFYSKLPGIKNTLRYHKFKCEQKWLFSRFNSIIFVSEIDEAEVNKYIDLKGRSLTVPIGCNIDANAANKVKHKDIDLIFTGNFHYLPNSHAVIFFLNTIIPRLILLYPDIQVYFVGRLPTQEMAAKAKQYKNNVFITGEVPSLEEFLLRAKIYISPLYLGSGMKNKILQAMANELPVIASYESTAGFLDKSNFLIAANENQWIQHIQYLLTDSEKRTQIGLLNKAIVRSTYSFEYIVKTYFNKLFSE